jgi:tetratricopeptide (TPR) repeat protein
LLAGPAAEGSLPAEGLHLLADAYSQLDQLTQAKEHYQAAIEAEPLRTEAHYRLAVICTRLGQNEQAREAMARFRELNAGSFADRKRGRVNYDDLQAMRADGAVFFVRAGDVCNARGRTGEAETLWRRAAAWDDRQAACRRELATLDRRLGNNEQAVRWLEELCRIQPDEAQWPLQLGELRASLSQFDAAEKAFQSVCEKMPQRFEGYASLAQLYLRADRNPVRALELLNKAVQLDSRAEGYALLGEAHQKNGNLAEAASAWKRAVELDPSNPQYRRSYESLRHE